MFEYLNEFDDMEMDVQVGPQEEIEAEVDDAPEELTPVDIAKKDPESVAVAAVEKKDDECEECEHEFYVDAKDVAKYADLNEETMLEALNDIIDVNEKYGMRADNLVVVVSESTMNYARNLEKNGCALMFIKEGDEEFEEDDIEMDVQVGPDGEEKVTEDPQEANPVDAVKREYDSVVVAKDDDEFFVDVEDVQKCADINCESVIETLNGIIAANEASGITAQNLKVIINENTDAATIKALAEASVDFNTKRAIKNDWAMRLLGGCRRYGLKVNTGALQEADKDLQNRRDVQPNNADKEALKSMNDEDLKNYYEKRKELAQHSKERRADIDSKSTFGKKSFDYGAHNRDYASDAAKEMKHRGLEVK